MRGPRPPSTLLDRDIRRDGERTVLRVAGRHDTARAAAGSRTIGGAAGEARGVVGGGARQQPYVDLASLRARRCPRHRPVQHRWGRAGHDRWLRGKGAPGRDQETGPESRAGVAVYEVCDVQARQEVPQPERRM